MSLQHAPRLRARARILLVMAALGILVAVWLLNSYKIDLVHRVVVNTVIQKAPPDYPDDYIERVFQCARKEAARTLREQEYLEKILQLSQRLEKVQSLAPDQVEEILDRTLEHCPRSPRRYFGLPALPTLNPDKAVPGIFTTGC